MKTPLENLWEKVHTSYWFVPTLMVALAILAAFALMELDTVILKTGHLSEPSVFGLLYRGGLEGSRSLLDTIAASIITVAGVIFSITVVVLSLASSEYGSMVLRNYMRSTGSQIVMGIFVGTFIYCLLVLHTIESRGENGPNFHIAVTFAVLLAVISIYAFIYFIHHISESIQAENIVQTAYHELRRGIDHMYPQDLGHGQETQDPDPDEERVLQDYADRRQTAIPVPKAGYLQAINGEKLMSLAQEHDLLLCLRCQPGDFLMPDSEAIRCYSREEPDEELLRKIIGAFLIDTKPTPEQDVRFTIDELVQVALRALSPSLNDPFTAMVCIDHLGAALTILARRRFPSRYRYDRREQLRIIAKTSLFSELVHSAFYQISYNCGPQKAVREHLSAILRSIASRTENEARRKVLHRMLEEVRSHGERL